MNHMYNRNRTICHLCLALGITCLGGAVSLPTTYARVTPFVQEAGQSSSEAALDALDPEPFIKTVKLTAKQQKSLDAIGEKSAKEIGAFIEKMSERMTKDVEGLTEKILKKHEAELQKIKALPEAEQEPKINALVKKAMVTMLPPVVLPYKKELSTQFRTTMTKIFADTAPLMTAKQKPLLATAKTKYFAQFDKKLLVYVNTFFDEFIKGMTKTVSQEN